MYQVISQELHKIEIALSGRVTQDEFKEVVHQLESLCAAHPRIDVMFDARNIESYEFKIVLDEYDFYTKYRSHLRKVAVVSDRKFMNFVMQVFNRFADAEIEVFPPDRVDAAREQIFPCRLPG